MMEYPEALKTILNAISKPATETSHVKKAHGRILAKDIYTTREFPDTRLSAIDGYAFRIDQLDVYKSVGDVGAGHVPDFVLQPGQCAAVMTGAPVPDGTDCMVRIEDCIVDDKMVRPEVALNPGDLINENSSEASAGRLLAKAGSTIIKSLYPALFYAGIPEVTVFKKPKIGMLLTGDELCDVDVTHTTGQVYDTNCYILESFLQAINLEVTTLIHARDDEVGIQNAFAALADDCDIIVSSGGVSMGQYDFVKKIFREQDFKLLIQGTAIKPGRPLMVAKSKGKLYFGMPGYPAAFLTNCLVYLIPALKKASGRTDIHHRFVTATLKNQMSSRKGKLYLNRARLELTTDGWQVWDPGSQKTSHFLNFSETNGIAFLTENVGNLEPGATVECLHYDLELC